MESTEERILHYQRGIERSVAVLDKPRLLHCIKALSKLPVTMKHLKSTGIGRTVNSLRKIEEGVGDSSKRLVTKWKEMVSNAPDSGESDEACVPDDPDNYESVNYEQEHGDDGEDGAALQSDSYNGINRPEALVKPVLSPPMVIDVNVSPEQEPAPNLSEEEEEEEPEETEETNYSQSSKHSSSKDKDSKKDSKSSGSSSKNSESKDKKESTKVLKSSKDNGHEELKKKDKDRSKSSSSSSSKKYSSEMKKRKVEESSEDDESNRSKKHSSEMKKRKVEESSEDDESNRQKQRLSVCENESDNDDDDEDEEANNFVIDDDDDHERDGESSSDERDDNGEAREKSRDASSLKHSDSGKSKSKDKRSNSSSSSSGKVKSKKDDKHKSKSSHSSSNGKDKEKHSKSKDDEKGKTKEKKEHKKSKEHKEKKKAKKGVVEGGIDSTTGTSFADALGMWSMPPPPKKKKEKESPSTSKTPTKAEQSSPGKSKPKTEQRPASPCEDSPEDSLSLLSPNVKLEPLTGDINEEVDLASTLPEPSPYYKPLPQVNIAQRRADEEDMLTIAINNKVQRTKVYSGNKSGWTAVPSLQEVCIRVLIENIDALEYTGGVPYDILQPILERASADQLQRLEYFNPYLVEETDLLWKFHCNKIFKTKQREEMESWRDMYERCMSEREAKFKAITANIKQSIDKSAPVRSTKLAYVDHFVKPPRNVLRQQAKYGTARVATSASDLKKKLITGAAGPSSSGSGGSSANTERISVPPPPPSRNRPPSSHPIKKAKAPLMAKALQAIKGRYKR